MAWDLPFKSDIGPLSLFAICFVIVIGAGLARHAWGQMVEDERNAR